jgi:hypothetical protein
MIHIVHPLLDIAIQENQLDIFNQGVLEVVIDQTLNENHLQPLHDVRFSFVCHSSHFIFYFFRMYG